MMELLNLRTSITQMSDGEGITLIGKIRANRRLSRKPTTKAMQKVKEEKKEVRNFLSNMSKDDAMELLKLLGESGE